METALPRLRLLGGLGGTDQTPDGRQGPRGDEAEGPGDHAAQRRGKPADGDPAELRACPTGWKEYFREAESPGAFRGSQGDLSQPNRRTRTRVSGGVGRERRSSPAAPRPDPPGRRPDSLESPLRIAASRPAWDSGPRDTPCRCRAPGPVFSSRIPPAAIILPVAISSPNGPVKGREVLVIGVLSKGVS